MVQIAIRISSKAPPNYTRRRRIWHMFAQEADVWEHRFLNVMKVYFRKVRHDVTERLREAGPSIEGQYRGWSRRKVEEHIARKAKWDRINIDPDAEAKTLYRLFDPLLIMTMERRGGEFVNAQLGTNIVFNVNDPAVKNYIGNRLAMFSKSVANTTFDEINATLRTGFTEGMSLSTIADTLRQRFESFEKYRAPLIARTETISALNKTDLLAIKQAKLEDRLVKAWLTAGDEAVRDTHAQAGIEYSARPIAIEAVFKVGKDVMQAPGLGSRAEENVNCRCTVEYIKRAGKRPGVH